MSTKKMLWILAALAILTFRTESAQAAIVGVTCANNSSTDANTLNTAITGSNTGDWIQIHGTCSLNATVVLLGSRTYTGDSRTGTILKQANSINKTAVVASDSWYNNSSTVGTPITLAHLTIDGNSSNNTSGTCLAFRSFQSTVEDVQISNCPDDGIRVSDPDQAGTCLTNAMENNTFRNLMIENAGAIGFHMLDPTGCNNGTDSNLESSWVADSGQSSIYLDNGAGWRIVGNHVYGAPQNAIYMDKCFSATISDNYIEGFGDGGGSGTFYGIGVALQGNIASTVISGNKINMMHITPSSGSYIYIGIIHGNYGVPTAVVSNNLIRGQGTSYETGLSYLLGAATSMYVLSNTNNVQSVNTQRVVGTGVTLATAW